MKSDYKPASFELKPIERATKGELAGLREWARKHPADFCFVRRSKRMVAQMQAQMKGN
jgi:hypothetical protein